MKFMGYDAHGNADIIMGITAFTISAVLFLYPLPTFFWISFKTKHADNMRPYPYLAAETTSLVWLLYSAPLKNEAITEFHRYCLLCTSFVGFGLHFVYTFVIMYFSQGEKHLFISYIPNFRPSWHHAIFNPEKTKVFGPAAIFLGIIMHVSCLPLIMDAWRNRRADYWLFGMCTLFCLNAAAWFTYSFSYAPTFDVYLAITYGCGFILGLIQLILSIIPLFKYRKSGGTEDPTTDLENPLLAGGTEDLATDLENPLLTGDTEDPDLESPLLTCGNEDPATNVDNPLLLYACATAA